MVGVSNTVLSYALFVLLFYGLLEGMTFWSQCISYAAGIIWSFTWNRKWTFSGIGDWRKQLPAFVILQTLLLLLSGSLLTAAAHFTSWNISLLWAVTMAVITVLNFILTKLVVFKGDMPPTAPPRPIPPRKSA